MGARPRAFVNGQAVTMLDRAMTVAVMDGQLYLTREMTLRTPVGATGNLRGSIRGDMVGRHHAVVGPTGGASLYAYWADQGRRPGTPPPYEAIAYWALRVLGSRDPAWAIVRKIARKGTKGSHFVRRTYREAGPGARRVMAMVVRDMMRRV
jgi:hypothetical protein